MFILMYWKRSSLEIPLFTGKMASGGEDERCRILTLVEMGTIGLSVNILQHIVLTI